MNDVRKPVVFFDGVCNLCTGTVQFILRRDKNKTFLFASLQGTAGQQLLQKFNLAEHDFDSFILTEGDRIYTRSAAVLRVLKKLGGLPALAYGFMILPRFIRDGVYSWIAKNRYKWFGKKEACWLPTPELQNRFLE